MPTSFLCHKHIVYLGEGGVGLREGRAKEGAFCFCIKSMNGTRSLIEAVQPAVYLLTLEHFSETDIFVCVSGIPDHIKNNILTVEITLTNVVLIIQFYFSYIE